MREGGKDSYWHDRKEDRREKVKYISLNPKLKDDEDADIYKYFGRVCRLLNKIIIESNQHILIHCLAGASRSVALMSSYLLYNDVVKCQHTAIRFIRERRSCAHPNNGFINQLEKWCLQCKARRGPRMTNLVGT